MKNLNTMERESRFATVKTMKNNREILIDTFRETRDTTPAETVKVLVNRMGYDKALETVAEMVNCVSQYDGRIFPGVREWAENVESAASREELERFEMYQPDAIHSCHINQLGESMRGYKLSV